MILGLFSLRNILLRIRIRIQISIANVLGKFGYPETAINFLLPLAQNECINNRYRLESAKALGQLGQVEIARNILLTILKNEDGIWRADAAEALGELGPNEMVEKTLLAILDNEEADIVFLFDLCSGQPYAGPIWGDRKGTPLHISFRKSIERFVLERLKLWVNWVTRRESFLSWFLLLNILHLQLAVSHKILSVALVILVKENLKHFNFYLICFSVPYTPSI